MAARSSTPATPTKDRPMDLQGAFHVYDTTLRDVALRCPRSLEDLAGITGIGARKREAYGDGILTVVAAS